MEKIIVNDDIMLTGFRHRDIKDLAERLNDIEIHRNTLQIPHPYTKDDARSWFRTIKKLDRKFKTRTNWAIRTADEQLIGGIGRHFTYGTAQHKDEIGYWLSQDYWNKGIMSATVRAYCNYLFETTSLARIEAHIFHFNHASAKVLENSGFQLEGLLRNYYVKDGTLVDSMLYAKIRTFDVD